MKIQIAKKMLNLLAVFAVILVCWSAAVFACEPECPDCWSGDDWGELKVSGTFYS